MKPNQLTGEVVSSQVLLRQTRDGQAKQSKAKQSKAKQVHPLAGNHLKCEHVNIFEKQQRQKVNLIQNIADPLATSP